MTVKEGRSDYRELIPSMIQVKGLEKRVRKKKATEFFSLR